MHGTSSFTALIGDTGFAAKLRQGHWDNDLVLDEGQDDFEIDTYNMLLVDEVAFRELNLTWRMTPRNVGLGHMGNSSEEAQSSTTSITAVSSTIATGSSRAIVTPQLNVKEHILYSEVLAAALADAIVFNWQWSCGLKSLAEFISVEKDTRMRNMWQGLLAAYIRGYDWEQVHGVYHHRVHNGYWQTFGGDTINRLSRWGDEWLMGIAYGMLYLLHSGPLGLVSRKWHLVQLSLQNVMLAHAPRINDLCANHLHGEQWDPKRWAQFLHDISVTMGVNPLTWPAWIVLAEWLVSKAIVAPGVMQRRVEVVSFGPLASGYRPDLTTHHIFQQCTGYERLYLEVRDGHMEARSWYWATPYGTPPWRPLLMDINQYAQDRHPATLVVLQPDPLPLQITMERPISDSLRSTIVFAQDAAASAPAAEDTVEEFLQMLGSAADQLDQIDFGLFSNEERAMMVSHVVRMIETLQNTPNARPPSPGIFGGSYLHSDPSMWQLQCHHYRRMYHETVQRERRHRTELTTSYNELVERTNRTMAAFRRVMRAALPPEAIPPDFFAPPLRRSTRTRTPIRRYNPDPSAHWH